MKITDCTSETLMLIVTQADGMDPAVSEAAAELDRRYGEGAVERYSSYAVYWRSSHSDMLADVHEHFKHTEELLRGEV